MRPSGSSPTRWPARRTASAERSMPRTRALWNSRARNSAPSPSPHSTCRIRSGSPTWSTAAASGVKAGAEGTFRIVGRPLRPLVRPLGFPPVEQQPDRRWIVLVVFALIAVGVVAAVLISNGGGDSDDETSAATETSAGGCETVEAPKPKTVSFKAPDQVLEQGEEATAVVKTNCGTFEIALDTGRAPKTANSFAFLAEEGFYDDLVFHRVVPGFVIQGGDPEGTGLGGPGYSVDEKPPPNLAYTKGVVAMAKS